MENKQKGYVLMLTMLVLSIIALLVTQLFNSGSVHMHFDQVMIDREKAKMLALGGIQLAMSQLSVQTTATGQKPEQKNLEVGSVELLKKIIPVLNRWQIFELKKDIDGIDGTVQIAISSEQGKVDLNQLFDFEKKKFKNEGTGSRDTKKIFQDIFGSMKKFVGDKDLFGVFEKFLKQRHYKLDDVTELLTIPEFQSVFKTQIFYEPPSKDQKAKRPIFLTDFFTVWSGHDTLQPWFLSDSLLAILNFKRTEPGDSEKRKKQIAELAKTFKGYNQPISQIWDKQLQPLYGKDYKSIPKVVQPLLDGSFEPTVFSLVSYGRVGKITQKIFAIIEKRNSDNHEEFMIKKLYWL
jgi:hypothetical protein